MMLLNWWSEHGCGPNLQQVWQDLDDAGLIINTLCQQVEKIVSPHGFVFLCKKSMTFQTLPIPFICKNYYMVMS